jgi:hypothetical protein
MRKHADETPQQMLNLELQSITIYDRTTGAKRFVEIVLRRRLCVLVGECGQEERMECGRGAVRQGQSEEAQEADGAFSQGHTYNLLAQLQDKRMKLDFSASRQHATGQESHSMIVRRPSRLTRAPRISSTAPSFLLSTFPTAPSLCISTLAQASDMSHPKEQSP